MWSWRRKRRTRGKNKNKEKTWTEESQAFSRWPSNIEEHRFSGSCYGRVVCPKFGTVLCAAIQRRRRCQAADVTDSTSTPSSPTSTKSSSRAATQSDSGLYLALRSAAWLTASACSDVLSTTWALADTASCVARPTRPAQPIRTSSRWILLGPCALLNL